MISLIGAELGPAATEVHVDVRLSSPVFSTVAVSAYTRNGSDIVVTHRAVAGRQFNQASQLIVFRPGDNPWRVFTVSLLGGADGQWFEVIIGGIEGGRGARGDLECLVSVV